MVGRRHRALPGFLSPPAAVTPTPPAQGVSRIPKVVILGAGEGIRLRPYTEDRPKCLVEVDGRSLLDRQLDVLRAAGARSVVIVGGYKSEKLQRADVTLRVNPRYAETNMVWSLFCAEDELDG